MVLYYTEIIMDINQNNIGIITLEPRLKMFLQEFKNNKNNKKNLEQKYNISTLDKIKINNYIQDTCIFNKYKIRENPNNLYYYKNPPTKNYNDIMFTSGPILGFNMPLEFSQQITSPRTINLDVNNIVNKLKPFRKYTQVPNFSPPFTNDTIEQFNVNDETLMNCFLPSRDYKRKSYGYNQPIEHMFDYISDDIQCAEHNVLPFHQGGESSRLVNKQIKFNQNLNDL